MDGGGRRWVIADRGGVYARDGKIGGHPPSIHPSHVNVIPADACVPAVPVECGLWCLIEAGDIGGRREMMITDQMMRQTVSLSCSAAWPASLVSSCSLSLSLSFCFLSPSTQYQYVLISGRTRRREQCERSGSTPCIFFGLMIQAG